jgi:hypothetical protein
MKAGTMFREPARVVLHLNDGFTKVDLERIQGTWDIPTERIPWGLRAIGSRCLVTYQAWWPEVSDSPEQMRAAMHDVTIAELTDVDF